MPRNPSTTTTRWGVTWVTLSLLTVAMVSCGGGGDAGTTSVGPTSTPSSTLDSTATVDTSVTSTTVASSASGAPTEESLPVSVAADTTTTSTVPPAAALVLRPDGVGDAFFGTDPDSVIGYVSAIIGPPTADSGWLPAVGPFGVCPGSEVRGTSWGDLTLLFGDSSTVATGRRHFFHYAYGAPPGETVEPVGMATPAGLGVGTTLTALFAAHPDAEVLPADELGGPYFVLGDGLVGTLSGTDSTATVISFFGGVGCGE